MAATIDRVVRGQMAAVSTATTLSMVVTIDRIAHGRIATVLSGTANLTASSLSIGMMAVKTFQSQAVFLLSHMVVLSALLSSRLMDRPTIYQCRSYAHRSEVVDFGT